MSKVCLQAVLYLAKKKENEIIDYSNFTYLEKVKLLEFYKEKYEELQSHSQNNETVVENKSVLNNDNNDGDFAVPVENTKDVETNKDIKDIKDIENVEVTENTESIGNIEISENVEDIEVNGNFETESSAIENEEYNEIEMVIEETNKTNISNDTNNHKESSFEYTSFTPYKPTYDNLNLNSNIYSMDLDVGLKMEVASADEKVEKYQSKKNNTNYKSTRDGNYQISDVYSATKEKYELPIVKVFVIAFALLALGISIIQFLGNYENMKLTSYIIDFGYGLLSIFILATVISKSEILSTFKGITLFVAVGFDFIFLGITQYQDNLYNVLNPSKENDVVISILILISVLLKYIYLIMCGVKTIIKKNIFKVSVVFASLAIVMNIIAFIIQLKNNTLDVFYDVLPGSLNVILILISLMIFEFKDKSK